MAKPAIRNGPTATQRRLKGGMTTPDECPIIVGIFNISDRNQQALPKKTSTTACNILFIFFLLALNFADGARDNAHGQAWR